jgi:hypothetical protein
LTEDGCHVGADPLFGEQTILHARRATLVTLTASGKKLTAMLKRDHRALARALFAQMPRREFDCFERGLADVIARLREHLASNSGRSGARSTPRGP